MKPNKLGIYVLISLFAFWAYVAVYLNICYCINVQPSDWMCVAFAVVTVAEVVITAWLKSGSKVDVDKKDVEFIAEIVGKVLNIEAPSMSSGSEGHRDEEEEDEEESEESDEGEADESEVLD